jgi:hypothetical protein
MKISFRLYKLLAKIILVIAAAVLIIAVAFVALRIHGRNKLYGKTDISAPNLSADESETGTARKQTLPIMVIPLAFRCECRRNNNFKDKKMLYNSIA